MMVTGGGMIEQDRDVLANNLTRIDDLVSRLVTALNQNQSENPFTVEFNPELFDQGFITHLTQMMANPAQIFTQQAQYWETAIKNWGDMVAETAAGDSKTLTDRRFKAESWQKNPYFSTLAEGYLQNAKLLRQSAEQLTDLSVEEKRQVDFLIEQYISLMAPANFLPSNPEALALAEKTKGESLVQGMENLVRDVENNKGRFGVSLSDMTAFELGKNVATSEGHVVFQNKMFQLLQFSPTTQQVCEVPLLIIPPWINKYYILDLQPENSFIKFATDAGLTVFVMSWVNPDSQYADTSFDDYMNEGTLVAIEEIRKITSQKQINAIGYCIGGTLLTCTLAWLAQNDRDPIKTATFFTTLTDFEDPGDLAVFITKQNINAVKKMVDKDGVMDAFYMGQIFAYLRPDNLVYGPAIKAYLMGQKLSLIHI